MSAGDVIAERYVVTRPLGAAAFSRTVAATDAASGHLPVCLKVIRSNKDFFDQSLDEIKLLQVSLASYCICVWQELAVMMLASVNSKLKLKLVGSCSSGLSAALL